MDFQPAIHLYTQFATLAVPYVFIFSLANIVVGSFIQAATGGKLQIK